MKPKTIQFEVTSEAQEALLRQFYAYVQEMDQLALTAPPGQVIDACEQMAWLRGQNINREVLQKAVQQRIDTAEKKGRR
jgi:hypothetical protein